MANKVKRITRKFYLIIIIHLSFLTTIQAQRLVPDSIPYYTLDHIYDEITQPDNYSIKECENFGSILANYDLKNGTKRLLVSYGMFYNPCNTCQHHKFGYSETNLGSGCEYYETSQAFKSTYNSIMKSILKEDELAEMEKIIPEKEIFNGYTTTILNFDHDRKNKNDSLFYFHIYSDNLENLFKDDIRFLKMTVTIDSVQTEYDYLQVKTIGVLLNTKGRKKMDISILLDFSGVPNNYDICWCSAIGKKYWIKLPLNLK
jgi:hypothetical protein